MYKNAAVSYARLFAMIMIILCHYFQFYNMELAWWFNVGVQLFLIISGFLYGQKEIGDSIEFLNRRCKKILLPFYLYLIGVTMFLLLVERSSISVSNVLGAFSGVRPYKGTEHLWFIPYIMFCYLLTPLLCALKNKIEKQSSGKRLAIFVLIILGAEFLYRSYGFYFRPSIIICYIVGYFYAIQVNTWETDKKGQAKTSMLIIGIALVLNIIRIYIKYVCYESLTGTLSTIFDLFEQYSHIALGLAIFVICLGIFKSAKYNVLIKVSDKYAYYIYIVHHIIINSTYSILIWINSKIVGIALSMLIILFSGVILCVITTKIGKINIRNYLN